MARRHRKTIDDQIAVLDEKIAKVQAKMDVLLEEKKAWSRRKEKKLWVSFTI